MTANGTVRIGEHDLRLDIERLCELEARFGGRSIQSIFADPGLSVIVTTIEVGCRLSRADAIALIQREGFDAVGKAVGDAATAAMPAGKGGDADPRKAASTG